MLTLFLFGIWGGAAGVIVPEPTAILFTGEGVATPAMRDEDMAIPRFTDEQVID